MSDELEMKKLNPNELEKTNGGYYTDENGVNWYYAFFCKHCNSGVMLIKPKTEMVCPNNSAHGKMDPRYW